MSKYLRMVYRLVILSILLSSCGSRKVELNKSDLETKTETKIEIVDTSNTEVRFDIERNTFTIEAKDNLKPFTYGGKTYFNAVLRQDNIKDKSLYRKENRIAYKEDNKVQTRYITKTKYITRKDNSYMYFIILIIISYIIYKLYLRYKYII